jgi:FAD:protein FMN transferase
MPRTKTPKIATGLVSRQHEARALGAPVAIECVLPHGADPSWLDEPLAAAVGRLKDAERTLRAARRTRSTPRRGDRGPLPNVPDDVQDLLLGCARARAESGGWFDPWRLVPGGCDPSGFVAGWAAQRALRALTAAPLVGASVRVGAVVASLGTPDGRGPHLVGVSGRVFEVTGAVASSRADASRRHLVNPWTGERSTAVACAIVTGTDAGLADALATALCVGGNEVLVRVEALPGYEALVVGHDGASRTTTRCPLVEA